MAEWKRKDEAERMFIWWWGRAGDLIFDSYCSLICHSGWICFDGERVSLKLD